MGFARSLILVVVSVSVGAAGASEENKLAFKRKDKKTEEELRKTLLQAPEVGFDQAAAAAFYRYLNAIARQTSNLPPDIGPKFYLKVNSRNSAMVSLPWIGGADAALGKEASEKLHVLSTSLRTCLQESVPKGDVHPEPSKLKRFLVDSKKSKEWLSRYSIPTLSQLLQAENEDIRLVMVETLGMIDGAESSQILAKRAVFDLSWEVRKEAISQLAERDSSEYEKILVDSLLYPWTPVADHAAEAIVALRLKKLTPSIVGVLKETRKGVPILSRVNKKETWTIDEVVRVNHLSNCMLCHAPSFAKDDLVRGFVPTPGEDPPPTYYKSASGLFARATVTYLRQDFSVFQPVANAGKWPTHQRFDYFLRTRLLRAKEITQAKKLMKDEAFTTNSMRNESALFALRELTGKNLGTTWAEWAPVLKSEIKSR